MSEAPIIKDVMTTKVVSVKAEMNIYEAIHYLLKNKISGAPVVDDAQQLVGILSQKDCLMLLVSGAYERLPTGKVEDYMSTTVHTCDPYADIFSVANTFMKAHYRRLPVVKEGRLVGIVSRRDILIGSMKLWSKGTVKPEWTDSKYLTDEIKAALSSNK